jgi:hypothetical protein
MHQLSFIEMHQFTRIETCQVTGLEMCQLIRIEMCQLTRIETGQLTGMRASFRWEPLSAPDLFEQRLPLRLCVDELGALVRKVVRLVQVTLFEVVLRKKSVRLRLLIAANTSWKNAFCSTLVKGNMCAVKLKCYIIVVYIINTTNWWTNKVSPSEMTKFDISELTCYMTNSTTYVVIFPPFFSYEISGS